MLLLATTTVTVTRPQNNGDPYEAAPATAAITASAAAHISDPSGADRRIGGAEEIITATLLIDDAPTLQRADIVTDDLTGDRYTVAWVRTRNGLGLDHQKAGLRAINGGASA